MVSQRLFNRLKGSSSKENRTLRQGLKDLNLSFVRSSAKVFSSLCRHKSLQEYKRVRGEHRALISKKIRLQAKTEALKKQFKEAVDQLTAVSGKIEAVEQEMEKAHARVKDQINAPRQPRITGVTNLLKEAGVTLSPDQTGALTKFLATVGDQDLDVPSLWKAEAGVPGELLDSDWFSQEANGRNGEYGPSRNDHRTRSNPLSRRSRSPTREGTNAET